MTIGDYMQDPGKLGSPVLGGTDAIAINQARINAMLQEALRSREVMPINKIGSIVMGVEDAVQRYVAGLRANQQQKKMAADSLKQQYENALAEQRGAEDALKTAVEYCIEHGIRAISEEEALGGK